MSDAGLNLLSFLYRERLRVDKRWVVTSDRGFTWWPSCCAQRIWSEPAREDAGHLVCRVHVQTDVQRKVNNDPQSLRVVDEINQLVVLSPLVFRSETGQVQLHSIVYVHEGNKDWLAELSAVVAASQLGAASMAQLLFSQMLPHSEVDASEHPKNGLPDVVDELVNFWDSFFRPQGQSPTLFAPDEFRGIERIGHGPSVCSTAGDGEITCEFPFFGATPAVVAMNQQPPRIETSLFQANGQVSHPAIGSGCFVRMTVPVAVNSPSDANTLNRLEIQQWTRCHLIGSWCLSAEGLRFVTFLPSAIFRSGLLKAFFANSASRNRWARDLLIDSKEG